MFYLKPLVINSLIHPVCIKGTLDNTFKTLIKSMSNLLGCSKQLLFICYLSVVLNWLSIDDKSCSFSLISAKRSTLSLLEEVDFFDISAIDNI